MSPKLLLAQVVGVFVALWPTMRIVTFLFGDDVDTYAN